MILICGYNNILKLYWSSLATYSTHSLADKKRRRQNEQQNNDSCSYLSRNKLGMLKMHL